MKNNPKLPPTTVWVAFCQRCGEPINASRSRSRSRGRLLSAAAGALVGAMAVDVYRRDRAPWWMIVGAVVYVPVGAIAGLALRSRE